jgi:hypothetical protein
MRVVIAKGVNQQVRSSTRQYLCKIELREFYLTYAQVSE